MDVAVALLLHPSSVGDLPLLLRLAHTIEGPASAPKDLDGISDVNNNDKYTCKDKYKDEYKDKYKD